MSFEHRDWCECNRCDCSQGERESCTEKILGEDYVVFRCVKCCGQTDRLSRGVESIYEVDNDSIDDAGDESGAE